MKYSISNKKKNQLYEKVSNDITNARIGVKIYVDKYINDPKIQDEIDRILYKLSLNCPDNAINIFKQQNK